MLGSVSVFNGVVRSNSCNNILDPIDVMVKSFALMDVPRSQSCYIVPLKRFMMSQIPATDVSGKYNPTNRQQLLE
jgi:hypothetical protein